MNDLMQEKTYLVAEDTDGRLYFYINSKEQEPQKYPDPKILYDGKEHAVLQRRPLQDVLLDFINEEVRDSLYNTHSVTIVESFNENITHSYYANMEKVDKLPFDINIVKE